jgi:hypothetical protein
MPDRGVIIMDRTGILNVIFELLRQRKQGVIGNLAEIQIPLIVFPFRIRTDLQVVKAGAGRGFIDELIDLVPRHGTIDAKQRPGDPSPVFAGPMLDVPYGCFDFLRAIGIARLNDCHALFAHPLTLAPPFR